MCIWIVWKKEILYVPRISYSKAKLSRKGKKTLQTGKRLNNMQFFSCKLAVSSFLLPNSKLYIFSPFLFSSFPFSEPIIHSETRCLRAWNTWRYGLSDNVDYSKNNFLMSKILPSVRKSVMKCPFKYSILVSITLMLKFIVVTTMSFDIR